MLAPLIDKHYRLWQSLSTPENDAVITKLLLAEARDAGAKFADGDELAGICEMLELQDRQSKYVISGQRTYEALGFSWRMPLWDDEYIFLWQNMPMNLKCKQNLYRDVLTKDNWGGVWENIPVNPLTIRPRWLIPVRLVAKAAMVLASKSAWRRLEKRMFGWWMDPLCNMSVVPYMTTLRDQRGARGMQSWLGEGYLAGHGIALSDLTKQMKR